MVKQMKALVLSGDAGTRLRPITHTSADPLPPVADKAVRVHGPESVAAPGATDAGMIVGDTATEIREAVADGATSGLILTCERGPEGRAAGLVESPEPVCGALALAGVLSRAPGVPGVHRPVPGDDSKVPIPS